MGPDEMRRRLENIMRATASANDAVAVGWWVGDDAGERRAMDNFQSGRRAWLGAFRAAKRGLSALDDGDTELAGLSVWQATDFLLDALWSRMEPNDIEFLSNSAETRGRRSSVADRDRALVDAVSAQETLGLRGKAAIRAALEQDSGLAAQFERMSAEGIRKAISRAKKRAP